jgi:pimeloyl-ACP methyl ester carboxylesterase
MLLKSSTVTAVAALVLAVTAVPAHADSPVTCADINTPIAVAGVPDGTIYGRYCRSAESSGKPLQILVPGITYTDAYFDFPGFGSRYSYTDYMNDRGYDTLAIDRLGMGRSTRPALGVLVNAFSNADALHQVVDAARSDGLNGRRYDKIVLTGHSYGTFVSDLTSATYHDVDGVIGTGWFQQPTALGLAGTFAILWPAAVDPRFVGKIIDPTYVTTRPGTRGFFYESANTDPAVIAADEATKDTASLSEMTYLLPVALGLTTRIGVPTLRVIGQYDKVICNPLPCTQSGLEQLAPALFPAGAAVYVQSGAGHDVALELNNTAGFDASLRWLDNQFPAS